MLEQNLPSIDDAREFLIHWAKNPRGNAGQSYGYEIYLPAVVVGFMAEVMGLNLHSTNSQQAGLRKELGPVFMDAAFLLVRSGILRPGTRNLGLQATDERASGAGFTITIDGRRRLQEQDPALSLPLEPDRQSRALAAFAPLFGEAFLQRTQEATRCYWFSAYYACCSMAGAAAESVLLATVSAKTGDTDQTLANYRSGSGRRRLLSQLLGTVSEPLKGRLDSHFDLISAWRDDAGHGHATNISEAEAHTAISRLLRLCGMVRDNWMDLTGQPPP